MGIKLTRVQVKAYRSITNASINLASGANSFVGANNVGKSNLMRAIALGFGEDIDHFDIQRDSPAFMLWGRPTITLWFRVEGPTSPERTLLRHAAKVEEQVNAGKPHYADDGILVVRVKYSNAGREEYLVTKGAGDRRAPGDDGAKPLAQLRKCVRFVLVRSGEDLSGFLQGRFTEVLHGVLKEADGGAMTEAQELREGYLAGLQNTLLQPLADRVKSELSEIAPEINSIELRPAVPSIEETIRSADVVVSDTATTSLGQKGTGIRGGLLVAMLRYLAEASKRSLVLAVEEPESFLHPRAQEAIRTDLEGLAQRSDVTLMVTTHSPFVVTHNDPAAVFMVRKKDDGATTVDHAEQDGLHNVVQELFGPQIMGKALSEAISSSAPETACAILVVEGTTDVTFLTRCAELHGLSAALGQLFIDPAGGAEEAALRALLWQARSDLPVLALFDHDERGRYGRKLATSGGIPKTRSLSYRIGWAVDDVEAEHLFAEDFVGRFVKKHGDGCYKAKAKRQGEWTYDIDRDYKDLFAEYAEQKATAEDTKRFVPVLKALIAAAGITADGSGA